MSEAQSILTNSPVKPIAVMISTDDIQELYAAGTNPDQYNQLILAKLKDAGAPVEGILRLRLAHGKVFKLRDNPLEPKPGFEYIWLPEEYVWALSQTGCDA